ncbi:ABC-type uncharacterized transport system ATPase subunit [Caldalkalibacillus uzonensis]|uniref:ABC-type uncharacterized transport system ATPase subunit n=1 Tax=Caldalkalibacillus uzonensis TaxID=353224 RepID=A0ABU0CSI1_9BACI|nr:ATP-binding cassette domain-containing protein [Caldalkalibacillus uzonensis]MDQ0338824.1 ABC-type uncharacterized transport system ATPase subunit [Caldalkalibacillus uzonensis]
MSLNTVLQCQKVTVDFDGFKAIDALDFEVKDKELHVLIGPNGAGKSTLLDVICGKVKPVGGQVIFKGQYHLNRLAEFEIARLGVGRKFQAPSIYPSLRVIEHLEIAMKQPKSLWHVLRTKLSRDEQMENPTSPEGGHRINLGGIKQKNIAQENQSGQGGPFSFRRGHSEARCRFI